MFVVLSAHFDRLCGLMFAFFFLSTLICSRISEGFLLSGKLSPVAISRCLGRGGRDGCQRGSRGGTGQGALSPRTVSSETGDLLSVFVLCGFVGLFVWPPKLGWKGKGLLREGSNTVYH